MTSKYPYTPRTDEWICIHPWSQLAITPTRDLRLCCHVGKSPPLGNLDNNSLEELYNGERMRQVRREMLNNQVPLECAKCKRIEDMGASSPRTREHTRWYAEEIRDKYIRTTQADGKADYSLKYWDVRFSNVCNMSCVMCNSVWSSQWQKHSKDYTKNYSHNQIVNDYNLLWMRHQAEYEADQKIINNPDFKWVDKYIDQVEIVYFAGGEPIIMPSHWYILEKLHEQKRFDVQVKYNTNMLKLSHQGKHVLDYWPDWPYELMVIECSLDETQERAEWIRYGTDWKRIEQNCNQAVQAGVRVQPIISVGAYNILRLPQIIEELSELAQNKVSINCVYNQEWRLELIDRTERLNLIDKLTKMHHYIHDPNQLDQIYHKLQLPQVPVDDKGINMLIARCALLDTHRNLNSMKLFPELEQINQRLNGLYEKKRREYE